MKRSLCLLFALLLVGTLLLCACSEQDPSASTPPSQTSEPSGPEALVPSLGFADYSGKTLRVLASEEDKLFCTEPFGATEINSEPVNDAIVARNAKLLEQYGFTIETEFVEPFTALENRVKQDIMTGIPAYDVVSTGVMNLANLAAEGYFLDLKTIENSHLDLTAEWWDVASNEDLTIMNKLYFTTGDILLFDDEYTRCVFYNKGLAADYNLGDISQLVFDKQWTVDKMYELAKKVAHDGDDGQMDIKGNDVWGVVGVAFDTYNLIMGCDAPQVKKDQNDVPMLAMLDGHNTDAFMKVYEFVNDSNVFAWAEMFYPWNHPDNHLTIDQFYNGKSLFMLNTLNVVNGEQLRSADIRYGILPMPMYDENQETYATTVDPYRFYCLSILNTCKDLDFVTFALEAMAYTSKQMVTPEYYDRTLKNKRFLDDNDSPEMLDILFSNRLVDIAVAFNWDDCIQYYNQIGHRASPELQSFVESKQGAFETAMNATLNLLSQLD